MGYVPFCLTVNIVSGKNTHLFLTIYCRRYIHDKEFFNRLVDTADQIPTSQWSSGGNALVMANRMAMEGLEVLLGSRVSKRLSEMLNDDVIGRV